MNSCIFIVRVISTPKTRVFSNNVSVIKIKVQQAKLRKKKKTLDKFEILLWGTLGSKFNKYYTVGNYLIVQGNLRFKKQQVKNRFQKNTQLNVKKLYPFLLNEVEKD